VQNGPPKSPHPPTQHGEYAAGEARAQQASNSGSAQSATVIFTEAARCRGRSERRDAARRAREFVLNAVHRSTASSRRRATNGYGRESSRPCTRGRRRRRSRAPPRKMGRPRVLAVVEGTECLQVRDAEHRTGTRGSRADRVLAVVGGAEVLHVTGAVHQSGTGAAKEVEPTVNSWSSKAQRCCKSEMPCIERVREEVEPTACPHRLGTGAAKEVEPTVCSRSSKAPKC